MLLLDFLQDITIILYFFGSKITNNLGLVGAVLFFLHFCGFVLIKLI